MSTNESLAEPNNLRFYLVVTTFGQFQVIKADESGASVVISFEDNINSALQMAVEAMGVPISIEICTAQP